MDLRTHVSQIPTTCCFINTYQEIPLNPKHDFCQTFDTFIICYMKILFRKSDGLKKKIKEKKKVQLVFLTILNFQYANHA